MSNIPSELKFTTSHEWIRSEGNDIYTVGLTDHAQSMLGEMVFIDLPNVGDLIDSGDDCAVAESVKAASDIYAPLTGKIIAVNEDLEIAPELINRDPYGDGWLFQFVIKDDSELDDLLDDQAYLEIIEDEA